MATRRVIDHKVENDTYIPVPINDTDDKDIYYDALDHIPTANRLATGYALTMGATIGYFSGYGIVPGIILPAIDEALIHYGLEKEHWISKAALSAAWCGAPITTLSTYIGSYAANAIAIVSSAITIKFSNDIFDQSKAICKIVESTNILQQVLDPEHKISAKELFKIIGTFGSNPINAMKMAKEDIAYLMDNKLIKNISLHIIKGTTSVGLNQLYMLYTGIAIDGATLSLILSIMGSNEEEAPNYYGVISTVLGYGGLYFTKNCLQSLISIYVNNKDAAFIICLEDLVRNKIYDKNNVMIMVDEDGLRHDDIITNSSNDITQILQLSIFRLNQMVDKCSAIPGSLSMICGNDDTFVLSLHMIQANILNKINEWVGEHIPDTSHLDTAITRIKSTSLSYFRDIVCSNNDKMIASKLNDLLEKQNNTAMLSQLFRSIKSNIDPIVNLLFTCCDALYFLQKISAGTTEVAQIPIILQNIDMFAGTKGQMISPGEEKRQKRLKILFHKKPSNGELREIEIDKTKDNVEFINYSLKAIDETYITIQHIKFSPGYYAIHAPSGAGKSSILQDIIYPLSGNMICTGKVKLPCKPENIIYISQKGFILPSGVASIFESITSQQASKIDDSTQKMYTSKILKLAEQIGLSLDEQKLSSQEYSLSGGEGKKVCIIKAILQSMERVSQGIKPVVILDEPFNELDGISIRLSEQALKQHVPKGTIVIIVDHNLQHNNNRLEDGSYFYDSAFQLDAKGSCGAYHYNSPPVDLIGE